MKTYRQQVCLFALAAVAMACGSGYSASRYVVLDLGVPPQAKGSCACGLNEAGVVVGFAAFEQPGGQVYPRAFAWHDGTWIELGVPGADQASVARRINNSGYIVGWSEQVSVRQRAVLWIPYWGGWYINVLRTLGGTSSAALDLNDAGWVVGWSDLSGDLSRHGCMWIHGWRYDLGAPPDETNSFAHAINAAGQIVGMASTGGSNPTAHAIVWEFWQPVYLMLTNARNCADDINAVGLVAGYFTVTNVAGPTRHACVWDLDDFSVRDLGVLPGDNASRAVAINNRGKVIGLSWHATDPFADPPFGLPETTAFHPFLFDPVWGAISNLNELIPPNSGYVINWVSDINDRNWIAGAARAVTSGGAQTRAVLLVPDPTIMRHPTNQAAPVGGSAVFGIEAAGTGPLFYQWWKDSMPVPGATNSVLALTNVQVADAGRYFVVVTNHYGSDTSRVAALTVNAVALDPLFRPHVNGEIYAFAVQPDGKVIVAGRFNWIGGVYRTNIARLNPDGSVDLGFDAAMPARTAMDYSTYVNCVLVKPDGRIVVGGYFDSVGGQPRTNIVRLLPDGAVDQSFGPAVVGVHEWWGGVNCMALQADGKVLIAGSFIEVGGLPRTNIARLNLDGSVDAEFSPAINGSAPDSVYALAVQPDGKIIVGGDFYYVNDVYRPLLARLNADGSLDEGFAPEIEGGEWPTVEALAVQDDGKILIGGWFGRVNGALRMNLARLNADGTVDSGFVVDVNGVPESFAQQADGKILFVGGFTEVNGIERVGIARVTRDGLLDLNFSPRLDSEVNWRASLTALAVQADGRVLIGGVFDAVNGQARTNLARLVNTAAAVESLGVDGSGIVWMRTGACPEVWRTAFDYSLDGQTWHHLGPGTRVVNGWRLAGVWPPGGSVLRARGYMTGGQGNGSSWFVETQAVPVSPIRLRIERTGTNVLLSWTGGLPPYQVQRVAELTSSNYWENVGEPVWTNAVALPLGPSNAFFRVYGRAQ